MPLTSISQQTSFWQRSRTSLLGKDPGLDGLSKLYYSTFANQLTEHFLAAFNSIPQDRPLPADTLRSHIVVIPKEGKDPCVCPSYRPIWLLNLDLKIFMKILSKRMMPSIAQLIHLDQVGFTLGREARDNTSRVLSLIHTCILDSHSPALCRR